MVRTGDCKSLDAGSIPACADFFRVINCVLNTKHWDWFHVSLAFDRSGYSSGHRWPYNLQYYDNTKASAARSAKSSEMSTVWNWVSSGRATILDKALGASGINASILQGVKNPQDSFGFLKQATTTEQETRALWEVASEELRGEPAIELACRSDAGDASYARNNQQLYPVEQCAKAQSHGISYNIQQGSQPHEIKKLQKWQPSILTPHRRRAGATV